MDKDLIKKINDAVVDMGSKVSYTDKNHVYQNIKTKEFLQGVSSVSNIVPKDWLSAWGAKEAVKFLGYSDYDGDHKIAEEMMLKIKTIIDPKEYISLLKEAKGASARKSKNAMVDGKKGHAWLESYVKAKINGTPLPYMPTDALKRPIEQFLDWELENIDYWILSEAIVSNIEHGYAGTLDALAMLKSGRLALVDFKFSSHISEDYFLQTAAYVACFENYDIKVVDRIIIRLPKTLEIEEWIAGEFRYHKVPNNIEPLKVPTNYEMDKIAFYHALPLKSWINQFNK